MEPNILPDGTAARSAESEAARTVPGSGRHRVVWWPPFPVVLALFLVFVYLHVRLRVNTRLAYFWLTPAFPTFAPGWAAFRSFAVYPGGLVQYAAAFLSQWLYYPWLGALIVTALAGLQCLALWYLLGRVRGTRPRVLHLVPAALVVVLYNKHSSPLPAALALTGAFAFACLYCGMPLRNSVRRFLLFAALGAALYYAAGGALLVYGALCGLYELLAGGRRLLGVICLPAAALAPYVAGVLALKLSPADAYLRLMPYHRDVDPRAAFVLLIACVYGVLAVLWAGLWRAPCPGKAGGLPTSLGGRLLGLLAEERPAAGIRAAILAALTAWAFWWSFDAGLTRWFEVEYLARRRAWPELLRTVVDVPVLRYDNFMNWDVNRALYHQGRLLDEMFAYPQHPRGLLPHSDAMEDVYDDACALMKLSDIFWDLGHVNESEHMAHEALESAGPRPWVLRRIAMARIVKGQPQAARVFLRALSNDVLFGKGGEKLLQRLEADPGLSEDEEVRRARQHMPAEDYAGHFDPETVLRLLLRRDPGNRMAFEYLMAHYLLTGNLEPFMASLGRLRDFGHARLPRHCQEAVLVYTAGAGRAVDLPPQAIDERTLKRFGAFWAVLRRHGRDREAARSELVSAHRDTYFVYYLYVLPTVAP